MIETPLKFLIDTVDLLRSACKDEDVQSRFDRAKDSIAHMAPEILHRGWDKIYWICKDQLNDGSNPHHKACFAIYTQRYGTFKQLLLKQEANT